MAELTDYMTLLEAAAVLGVSKSRVEQYVSAEDGRLKVAAVLGGRRLVLRSDVAALKPQIRPRGRPKKEAARPDG